MKIIEKKVDELVRRSLEGHTLYALKNRIANYRSEIASLEQKLQSAYNFRASKDYADYQDHDYDESRRNLLEAKKQTYLEELDKISSNKDSFQEQLYHSESHVYQVRRRQNSLQQRITKNEEDLDKLTPETEVYNAISDLIKSDKAKLKGLDEHLIEAQKEEDEKEQAYQTLFASETFYNEKVAEIDEELNSISLRLTKDYIKVCERAIDTYSIDATLKRIDELKNLIEVLSQDPEELARDIKKMIASGNKEDEVEVKKKGKELSLISNGGIDTSVGEKEHTLTKTVEIAVESEEEAYSEVEQLGQLLAVTSNDAKDLVIEIRQAKEANSLCQESCQIVTNLMSKNQDEKDKQLFERYIEQRNTYGNHINELDSAVKSLEEQARNFIYNSLVLKEKLELAKARYSEVANGKLLTMENIEERIENGEDICVSFLEKCIDNARQRFLSSDTSDGVMTEEEEESVFPSDLGDSMAFTNNDNENVDANELFGGYIVDDEEDNGETPEEVPNNDEVKNTSINYDYNPKLDLSDLDEMFAQYTLDSDEEEIPKVEEEKEEEPEIKIPDITDEEVSEDTLTNISIPKDEEEENSFNFDLPSVGFDFEEKEEEPEISSSEEKEEDGISLDLPEEKEEDSISFDLPEEKEPDSISFDLPEEKEPDSISFDLPEEKEPDSISFDLPKEKEPDSISFDLPKEKEPDEISFDKSEESSEPINPEIPSFDVGVASSLFDNNDIFVKPEPADETENEFKEENNKSFLEKVGLRLF